MFTSWSQLTSAVTLCTFAIAASAVPFKAPRQTACDTNTHKIGILWKGTIAGWLGSPRSPHPEKIGLVLDESTAHTFQISSCVVPPSPATWNSLICTDCDPSANVVGGVSKADPVHEGLQNMTMIAGPASQFALGQFQGTGWTFDGSEYHPWTAVGGKPWCWYDGTKSQLSVSVMSPDGSSDPYLTSNCQFVVQ